MTTHGHTDTAGLVPSALRAQRKCSHRSLVGCRFEVKNRRKSHYVSGRKTRKRHLLCTKIQTLTQWSKSALFHLWHAHSRACFDAGRAVQGGLGTIQAKTGAPSAEEAMQLAVVDTVLSSGDKALGAAAADTSLALDAGLHAALTEVEPRVGAFSAVGQGLRERPTTVATTHLVHGILVCTGAPPSCLDRHLSIGQSSQVGLNSALEDGRWSLEEADRCQKPESQQDNRHLGSRHGL